MTEQGKKYLADILMAIDLIEDFTKDIIDFDSYDKDLKTQSASERQLVIIGEALSKLLKVAPSVEIANEIHVKSFRNRLVHAYDNIDNAIVWMVIKKHLPNLKKDVLSMYIE